MTEFSRAVILEKVNALLNREISPTQAYEWVLGFVVAKGYDHFSQHDPLSAKAVQMLMDVNDDYKISLDELRKMEYYRQCLAGEREFVPDDGMSQLPDIPQEILEKWRLRREEKQEQEQKSLSLKDKLLHWMRIYVYVYAGYILLWNLWVLISLGGPWSPKRTMAMITYPFFVYGALLILPMHVLMTEKFFMGTLVLAILAVAFFWFDFFRFLFSPEFHFLGFLVKLFLGGIPALVTVWLLMYEKYLKDRKIGMMKENLAEKENYGEEDSDH